MTLIHVLTRQPVTPGAELVARDTRPFTLVDYVEDGAGSGFCVVLPEGKRGARNHEEYRANFFGLEAR
jgi:hypothetical protein